jgi:flagellar biosynthesis/type III secretory pathway protein FliH
LWDEHFGKRVDDRQNEDNIVRGLLEENTWYEVIDMMEYISSYVGDIGVESDFNDVLEEEKSAYRIVDGEAVPITDEIELEAIEEGMEKTRKYEGVREHLEQALAHFSEKDDPVYRNSVKESISAAESMAQIVIGDEDATLGQALSKMEQAHGLNGALKSSFSSLYGYASDQEGIRHALSELDLTRFSGHSFTLLTDRD